MARMYHPDTGHEITVADDDTVIAIHSDSGWELAPEPEAIPGHEPEPLTYEPVAAKAKRGAKTEPKGKDTT